MTKKRPSTIPITLFLFSALMSLTVTYSMANDVAVRLGANYFLEVTMFSGLFGFAALLNRTRLTTNVNEKTLNLTLLTFALFPFSITFPFIESFPEMKEDAAGLIPLVLYANSILFYVISGFFSPIELSSKENEAD